MVEGLRWWTRNALRLSRVGLNPARNGVLFPALKTVHSSMQSLITTVWRSIASQVRSRGGKRLLGGQNCVLSPRHRRTTVL